MSAEATTLKEAWTSRNLAWPNRSRVDSLVQTSLETSTDVVGIPGRGRVQGRLFSRLMDLMSSGDLGSIQNDESGRTVLREVLDDLESRPAFSVIGQMDRGELERNLMAELTGWGPLAGLLEDPTVSDVLVNGPDNIWVDRYGRLEQVNVDFEDEAHLRRIMDRMVASHGRHLEEAYPYVDVRLPDGSRLHASIPPISEAPILAIRRAAAHPLRMQEVVAAGSLSPEMQDYLTQVIGERRNLLLSGGAASGKTTLLNILAACIPDSERLITIEETRELRFDHPHVVPLEARMANTEGRGEIDLQTLVANALRMRADRIIVGEVRGGEVMNMIQAMNVGHHGSMTTIHSNGAADALRRLETLMLLSGVEISVMAVRELLAATMDVVVHLVRDQDGGRRITEIVEVLQGTSEMVLRPVFTWDAEQQVWNDERVGAV